MITIRLTILIGSEMVYTEIRYPDKATQQRCSTVGGWLKENFAKNSNCMAVVGHKLNIKEPHSPQWPFDDDPFPVFSDTDHEKIAPPHSESTKALADDQYRQKSPDNFDPQRKYRFNVNEYTFPLTTWCFPEDPDVALVGTLIVDGERKVINNRWAVMSGHFIRDGEDHRTILIPRAEAIESDDMYFFLVRQALISTLYKDFVANCRGIGVKHSLMRYMQLSMDIVNEVNMPF